ncbi:hypothetical protein ACQP1O_20670 [Nocardia sp. CA-151230]|uniref:hypothetical protein n=1 Tax=Nocardia sp. CA-151230 TaxID=3239982 RepID=UPI003D8B3D9D
MSQAKEAYQAEQAARCVERARRFHADRPVLSADFPELPDDEDFYAACDSGREWDGHWYPATRSTPGPRSTVSDERRPESRFRGALRPGRCPFLAGVAEPVAAQEN